MATKRNFRIKTQFIFTGYFDIKAESKAQAIEYIGKHCGLVIGGDIHSTLPSEDIDWEFDVHPIKKIG